MPLIVKNDVKKLINIKRNIIKMYMSGNKLVMNF